MRSLLHSKTQGFSLFRSSKTASAGEASGAKRSRGFLGKKKAGLSGSSIERITLDLPTVHIRQTDSVVFGTIPTNIDHKDLESGKESEVGDEDWKAGW